ncbi:LacI family DNA-binding transcriptional regulator [Dyadobacter bucti]|uniref:LacI family DNA-binding transcriptional regulator n=1 Tax=Dyadobacter bucti TaxID=2572203 RepID=UPI001109F7C6|nr:LacI family DNA-binding transcriptional regulator [Dyadobacter bucti]
MEKEITIYDIAKILGLSPATVSRALNDHPAININTKTSIVTKASELGYRSNTFASNLRKRKTNTLGVIVPRLNSNFMSAVLAGMEEVANEAGYNLIISQSLESVKKEIANARTMFNSMVDGLLASVAYDTDDAGHFESFVAKGIPVIFFDRIIGDARFSGVTIDNVKAGYEVTRHLVGQGCSRILHVTGNLKRNVYAGRMEGYKRAIAEFDLPQDESLILVTDLGQEAGKAAAQYLHTLPARPDGIFLASDVCAVSCIQALKEIGYVVPGDVAVAGFNNDPVSQVIEPNLTTVHYPGDQIGQVAVKTMINHLNGHSSIHPASSIILDSELIIRGSSLRKKKGN